jgi:hypothetical protein
MVAEYFLVLLVLVRFGYLQRILHVESLSTVLRYPPLIMVKRTTGPSQTR